MDTFIRLAVGRRIRRRRKEAGLSRDAVANALGRSRQKTQNYETGRSQITVPTLYMLAQTLHVPVADLLDDLPPLPAPAATNRAEPRAFLAPDLTPDAQGLVDNFAKLPPSVRSRLVELLSAVTDDE